VPDEILEEALAMHVIERYAAGLHAVEERAPRDPVVVVDDHEGEVPERARDAAPQRRGRRRQPEAAVRRLGEHADARECPEHPVHERPVRTYLRGDGLDSFRPLGKHVRDAELRGDEDHLRHPVAGDVIEHRLLRLRTSAGRHCAQIAKTPGNVNSSPRQCPETSTGRVERSAHWTL
jgi:hypothetical protein